MIQLEKEDIILNLTASNKEGVLTELTKVLQRHCPRIELENLQRVVYERELIGSTGVGNGVAIPHGKIEGLEHILICFGRSQGGVNYDAIDNQPVTLFVLILSPQGETDDYLKTLAQVSRLLKKPENRRTLRLAESKEQVLKVFTQTG
jgi:PTS system nitrogen regulatory IIA component